MDSPLGERAAVGNGCLDDLFELVATDRTGGVMFPDEDSALLYHPCDGGGDVIAPSAQSRDRIAEHQASWLSGRPDALQ